MVETSSTTDWLNAAGATRQRVTYKWSTRYTKNATAVKVSVAPISLSPSIKSLGVILDSHLTIDDHVAAVCNSLLAEKSETNFAKVHCIQNTHWRAVTGTRRSDHVQKEVIPHHTCCTGYRRRQEFKYLQTSDTDIQDQSDQFTAIPSITSFRLQTGQESSIIGEASVGIQCTTNLPTKAEDFAESIPLCSCRSLEYSSYCGHRMRNSQNIQKTSDNTPLQ